MELCVEQQNAHHLDTEARQALQGDHSHGVAHALQASAVPCRSRMLPTGVHCLQIVSSMVADTTPYLREAEIDSSQKTLVDSTEGAMVAFQVVSAPCDSASRTSSSRPLVLVQSQD